MKSRSGSAAPRRLTSRALPSAESLAKIREMVAEDQHTFNCVSAEFDALCGPLTIGAQQIEAAAQSRAPHRVCYSPLSVVHAATSRNGAGAMDLRQPESPRAPPA